ncbi:MAG: ABC transporter ATP-binding protein [Candidatus Bathyarchaeota archaeon]|nr:ABC transporter ATP-binding protein [Candidatus Bathyarchaeota archaeon]
MSFAVETEGLVKRYDSLVAVDRLSLRVKRGAVHGFLGPNGAGKTTTIKVLVGLLRPDEGSVKVLGEEIHGKSGVLGWFVEQADSRLGVGYMPELPKFPKFLKGAELLDVYGRMYGMSEQERRERIPHLVELVGLRGRENDLIGKYSKGMQQRIGIAQALLNSPELVILDEPSLGLDPVGMVEVRELVKEIAKEGITVLVSSHLLFEVEQICTDVTIINRGKALVSDTLQNVSSMLSGPALMHVEVSKMSKEIVEGVRELPFVSDVIVTGNTLRVQVSTREDVRVAVSQQVTKLGGVIVGMSQKTSNLEDVFIQLITKDKQGGKKQ